MSKIIVLFEFPNMTIEKYDEVWQDIRAGGHENPDGLIHHAGAAKGEGVFISDVWESAEKFSAFGQILVPLLGKNGVEPVEPTVLPVHYHYS